MTKTHSIISRHSHHNALRNKPNQFLLTPKGSSPRPRQALHTHPRTADPERKETSMTSTSSDSIPTQWKHKTRRGDRKCTSLTRTTDHPPHLNRNPHIPNRPARSPTRRDKVSTKVMLMPPSIQPPNPCTINPLRVQKRPLRHRPATHSTPPRLQ